LFVFALFEKIAEELKSDQNVTVTNSIFATRKTFPIITGTIIARAFNDSPIVLLYPYKLSMSVIRR
jgi:hypothetical protein